ncbi:MAG: gfo/Idh/MocA family oxidoreductase [Opitutus sp.]|nr:gfo/Idh/MocA family oxidoreductase [Opitutus sp.]
MHITHSLRHFARMLASELTGNRSPFPRSCERERVDCGKANIVHSLTLAATQRGFLSVGARTFFGAGLLVAAAPAADLRLGMIGLDTGHVIEFSKILHVPTTKGHVAGARVVAAYRAASPDIESSWTKVGGYTEKLEKEFGVKLYNSIEELVKNVDGVLIESVDARPHLAQASAVIRAGKPLFIEKPIGASLKEALEIFALAKQHRVPVFSSSALRFGADTLAVRGGSIGRVLRAETNSPAPVEPHHIDLFWYGIHGVESLFTVMGAGIESVARQPDPSGLIVAVGQWPAGRTGTFREVPRGTLDKTYGGRAVGEKGEAAVGKFDGYAPLVAAIVKFFQTGTSPVPPRETLEILAFMEADALSKERGGKPVMIEEILARAGWKGAWPGAF